jgi:hypothetical protein
MFRPRTALGQERPSLPARPKLQPKASLFAAQRHLKPLSGLDKVAFCSTSESRCANHHWLGWLAVNLAMLWRGVEMSQPPPEPVAMAAFDDAYIVPTEFQLATVEACP